jgi:hypothetical protein
MSFNGLIIPKEIIVRKKSKFAGCAPFLNESRLRYSVDIKLTALFLPTLDTRQLIDSISRFWIALQFLRL